MKTLLAGIVLGVVATVVACMVWAYRQEQGREVEEWALLGREGRG